ncbi:MAG: DNA-methyltransferase [Phycisphaerales bacterium]
MPRAKKSPSAALRSPPERTPDHAPDQAPQGPLARPKGTPSGGSVPRPDFALADPDARFYVGDCRAKMAAIPEVRKGEIDLVFADPPFNWNRAYDQWDDSMPREDYLQFTRDWLDLCVDGLKPTGSMWVNIPDDTAAEIVVHLKARRMHMVNWCVWHYRFGQNRKSGFINSKVHALYFCKDPAARTWNPESILEPSDRASTYYDVRTTAKADGMPPGMRVPLDVWYGKFWGRVQGTSAERRPNHDNQLPEIYLERVVRCSSNEGDLVLDPFIGSGTTAVMARALKRRFIGTEFSKANAASAFERLQHGPARPLGEGLNASTAIFEGRKAGAKVLARQGHLIEPRALHSRTG